MKYKREGVISLSQLLCADAQRRQHEMSDVVIVGGLSLIGVIASAVISAIVSNSLIRYRLESLEKKVDSHNGYAEKFSQSSQDIALIKQDISHLRELMEKKHE